MSQVESLPRPVVLKTSVQNCTDEVIVMQFGAPGHDFGEIRLVRRPLPDDAGNYVLSVDAEQTQHSDAIVAIMQHAADELTLSMLTLTSAIHVLRGQSVVFEPSL